MTSWQLAAVKPRIRRCGHWEGGTTAQKKNAGRKGGQSAAEKS